MVRSYWAGYVLISVYDPVENVGVDPAECALVSLGLRFAKLY